MNPVLAADYAYGALTGAGQCLLAERLQHLQEPREEAAQRYQGPASLRVRSMASSPIP